MGKIAQEQKLYDCFILLFISLAHITVEKDTSMWAHKTVSILLPVLFMKIW